MSTRLAPPKQDPKKPPRKAPPPGGSARFDKAFQVWLEGESGVAAGVGRNITDAGLFVETREPFALGTRVRVTFPSASGGAEMTLEAEVRYQCFINFARADSTRAGLRGHRAALRGAGGKRHAQGHHAALASPSPATETGS